MKLPIFMVVAYIYEQLRRADEETRGMGGWGSLSKLFHRFDLDQGERSQDVLNLT